MGRVSTVGYCLILYVLISCNGVNRWPLLPTADLYESQRGSNTIKQQGKGGQKLMPQSWRDFFSARTPLRSHLRCIFNVYTTGLSSQRRLMDSLHKYNLLRPAMTIDGHISQFIAVDNVDRLTVFPVYRQ